MRLLRLTLPIALLALLSACVPTPAAAPTPTDAATEARLFATDEEALAAAEEVYREYLRVADLVRAGGDFELLKPLATGRWFEHEREVRDELHAQGVHLVGNPVVTDIALESFDSRAIRIYACHETVSVRLVDEAGLDVTPSDRPDTGLLIVTLTQIKGRLLIDGSELWSTSC